MSASNTLRFRAQTLASDVESKEVPMAFPVPAPLIATLTRGADNVRHPLRLVLGEHRLEGAVEIPWGGIRTITLRVRGDAVEVLHSGGGKISFQRVDAKEVSSPDFPQEEITIEFENAAIGDDTSEVVVMPVLRVSHAEESSSYNGKYDWEAYSNFEISVQQEEAS